MKDYPLYKKIIFVLTLIIFMLNGFYGGFLGTKPCQALTIEEERAMGKKFKLELDKHLELIKDSSIQEYIDRVGKNITSQIDNKIFDFNFYIYKSSDPNAFAIPAGYIYISTGLITLAENEAELAGVLSHEIGHVMARHIAERIEKESKLNIATLAAILAGVFLGGGGQASSAVGAFSIATAQTLSLKYSRENEEEADRLGLNYLTKAGYDGSGMIGFLKKIKRHSLESFQLPPYLLTHPEVEKRIDYLDLMLMRFPKQGQSENNVDNLRIIQAKVIVDTWVPKNAAAHFKSSLESDSKRLDLIYGLALANKKLGDYGEAIKGFKMALTIHPEDGEILREMGICYLSEGKTEDAAKFLKKSVVINEKDKAAWYNLGRVYQESGNFQEAIEAYQRVKRLDTDFVDVYYNLGVVYGKKGLLGDAHQNFGIFFKLKGKLDSALFHFNKALGYYGKDTEESREILKEVEEIRKKDK
ncbi:MAG: M48 family metalloprotease [Desulfobacterales bacterium]|nr:M48 family metalloprotease [Desulfobacterales bacterium]